MSVWSSSIGCFYTSHNSRVELLDEISKYVINKKEVDEKKYNILFSVSSPFLQFLQSDNCVSRFVSSDEKGIQTLTSCIFQYETNLFGKDMLVKSFVELEELELEVKCSERIKIEENRLFKIEEEERKKSLKVSFLDEIKNKIEEKRLETSSKDIGTSQSSENVLTTSTGQKEENKETFNIFLIYQLFSKVQKKIMLESLSFDVNANPAWLDSLVNFVKSFCLHCNNLLDGLSSSKKNREVFYSLKSSLLGTPAITLFSSLSLFNPYLNVTQKLSSRIIDTFYRLLNRIDVLCFESLSESPLLYPVSTVVSTFIENSKEKHHLLWFSQLRDTISNLCGVLSKSMCYSNSLELDLEIQTKDYGLASGLLDSNPLLNKGLAEKDEKNQIFESLCLFSKGETKECEKAKNFHNWVSKNTRDLLSSKKSDLIERFIVTIATVLIHTNNKSSEIENFSSVEGKPEQWIIDVWQKAYDLKLQCFRERTEEMTMEQICTSIIKKSLLLIEFLPPKQETASEDSILSSLNSKSVLSFVLNKSYNENIGETISLIIKARNNQSLIQKKSFDQLAKLLQQLKCPSSIILLLSNVKIPFSSPSGVVSHYIDFLNGASKENKNLLRQSISNYFKVLNSLLLQYKNDPVVTNYILCCFIIFLDKDDFGPFIKDIKLLDSVRILISEYLDQDNNKEPQEKSRPIKESTFDDIEDPEVRKKRLNQQSQANIKQNDQTNLSNSKEDSISTLKEVLVKLLQLISIESSALLEDSDNFLSDLSDTIFSELERSTKNYEKNKETFEKVEKQGKNVSQRPGSQNCLSQEKQFYNTSLQTTVVDNLITNNTNNFSFSFWVCFSGNTGKNQAVLFEGLPSNYRGVFFTPALKLNYCIDTAGRQGDLNFFFVFSKLIIVFKRDVVFFFQFQTKRMVFHCSCYKPKRNEHLH